MARVTSIDPFCLVVVAVLSFVALASPADKSLYSPATPHRNGPLFQLGEARRLTPDMLGPPIPPAPDRTTRGHPRLLHNASSWKSLIMYTASQKGKDNLRCNMLRTLGLMNGPFSPALQKLANATIANTTELYDGRAENSVKWNEYKAKISKLSSFAGVLPLNESITLPLCAFWYAVSTVSAEPFVPSDEEQRCTQALLAHTSSLLAWHIENCNSTTCGPSSSPWWGLWGRPSSERWSAEDDKLAAAIGHVALAYDVLHYNMSERARATVRSALTLLSHVERANDTVPNNANDDIDAALFLAKAVTASESVDLYTAGFTRPYNRTGYKAAALWATRRAAARARRGRPYLSRVARDAFALAAAARLNAHLPAESASALALAVLSAPRVRSSAQAAGIVARSYNGGLGRAAMRAAACGYSALGRVVEETFLQIKPACGKDDEVDDVLGRLPDSWLAPAGTDWAGRASTARAAWSTGFDGRVSLFASNIEWVANVVIEVNGTAVTPPTQLSGQRACANGSAAGVMRTVCALPAGIGDGTLIVADSVSRPVPSASVVQRVALGNGVSSVRAGCGAPLLDARGCWILLRRGTKTALLSSVGRGRVRWATGEGWLAFATSGWAREGLVLSLRANISVDTTPPGGALRGGRVGAPIWVLGDGVTYAASFRAGVLVFQGVRSSEPPVKPLPLTGGLGAVHVKEGPAARGIATDPRNFVAAWDFDLQLVVTLRGLPSNGRLDVRTCGAGTTARTRISLFHCQSVSHYERRACTMITGNEVPCSRASGRVRWSGDLRHTRGFIIVVVSIWRLPGMPHAAVEVTVNMGGAGGGRPVHHGSHGGSTPSPSPLAAGPSGTKSSTTYDLINLFPSTSTSATTGSADKYDGTAPPSNGAPITNTKLAPTDSTKIPPSKETSATTAAVHPTPKEYRHKTSNPSTSKKHGASTSPTYVGPATSHPQQTKHDKDTGSKGQSTTPARSKPHKEGKTGSTEIKHPTGVPSSGSSGTQPSSSTTKQIGMGGHHPKNTGPTTSMPPADGGGSTTKNKGYQGHSDHSGSSSKSGKPSPSAVPSSPLLKKKGSSSSGSGSDYSGTKPSTMPTHNEPEKNNGNGSGEGHGTMTTAPRTTRPPVSKPTNPMGTSPTTEGGGKGGGYKYHPHTTTMLNTAPASKRTTVPSSTVSESREKKHTKKHSGSSSGTPSATQAPTTFAGKDNSSSNSGSDGSKTGGGSSGDMKGLEGGERPRHGSGSGDSGLGNRHSRDYPTSTTRSPVTSSTTATKAKDTHEDKTKSNGNGGDKFVGEPIEDDPTLIEPSEEPFMPPVWMPEPSGDVNFPEESGGPQSSGEVEMSDPFAPDVAMRDATQRQLCHGGTKRCGASS